VLDQRRPTGERSEPAAGGQQITKGGKLCCHEGPLNLSCRAGIHKRYPAAACQATRSSNRYRSIPVALCAAQRGRGSRL